MTLGRRHTIDSIVDHHSDLEKRTLRAQAVILNIGLKAGVQVSFGESRRATDVAMAVLKGDREVVLALPTRIEDELGYDLHVLRSAFTRDAFELLVVLTEPLDTQGLRSPERRATLRRRLNAVVLDPEGADLLDMGGGD
ncbi:MAG TPA: hypothetical protein VFN03_09785 [Trueperaceae bacterium]|nr:hypothetical protein [Trueperaceae bacterium]